MLVRTHLAKLFHARQGQLDRWTSHGYLRHHFSTSKDTNSLNLNLDDYQQQFLCSFYSIEAI